MLAMWAVAGAIRWQHLQEATLGSDALGQFLAAWTVLSGGAPVPPNPEGGHSLWLLGLPCVLIGRSLEGVFAVRFVLGALVAPLGAAAAWVWAPPSRTRWLGAVVTGLMLAWDPGLVDTLVVSFRGYGAPELVALALLAAGLGGRLGAGIAGASAVAATGQHPMAAGLALGVVGLVGRWGRQEWQWALGCLVVAALPRLVWLWSLGSCGAGFMECLGTVATGSAEPDVDRLTMLKRAFWDRFVVETGPGVALALGVGLLVGLWERHTRSLTAVVLLAGLGVLLLGLGIQGLRPYHLRALMPFLAVAVGCVISVRPALLVALAGCVVGLGIRWTAPSAPDGGVRGVDAFGAALASVDVPMQVEAVWFGDPVGVEPGAVVLSARQHGLDPARQLVVDGSGPVVLIVNLADDPTAAGLVQDARIWPELDAAATWPDVRVLRAESLDEARAWLQSTDPPPVVAGGSFDWVKAFKPSVTDHQSL
ncbi:MAG TPA: hypothetical protein DFR83_22390 [Deltaproteobacteria bacterium]|nr:hypothetical protein [Deltaproteobacteria bacterium]